MSHIFRISLLAAACSGWLAAGCATVDDAADAAAEARAADEDVASVAAAARAAGRLLRPDVNQNICLDAAGGAAFARPYLRACDRNNANLRWTLTARNDGLLQPDVNPGLCVDAAGGVAGAQVYMRPCDANNGNHQWTFRADGQLSPRVNPNLCLDAGGGVAGPIAYLRGCNANNGNLRWSFDTSWKFVASQCTNIPPSGISVNTFSRCVLGEAGRSTLSFACGSNSPLNYKAYDLYVCSGN